MRSTTSISLKKYCNNETGENSTATPKQIKTAKKHLFKGVDKGWSHISAGPR